MIWIIGKGMLGTAFSNKIEQENYILTPKTDVDICNIKEIKEFLENKSITLILNCSGYTDVDKAEEESKLAYSINYNAIQNLTEVSNKLNIPLVHFSTDYVFSGETSRSYVEDDDTKPLSVYGKSKLEGDLYILNKAETALIFRTSWLYDSVSPNFVTNIQRLGREKDELLIVADQIGTPTYVYDLVETVLKIIPQIEKNQVEIYHYSNEGVTSWYDFAYFILKYSKIKCKVIPILSTSLPRKAVRPKFSVLDKNKVKQRYNITIPHWAVSLEKSISK